MNTNNNNQENSESSISSSTINFENSLEIGISILADMTRESVERSELYFDIAN